MVDGQYDHGILYEGMGKRQEGRMSVGMKGDMEQGFPAIAGNTSSPLEDSGQVQQGGYLLQRLARGR